MFYCQRESFARELETEVVSVTPVSRVLELEGRKQTVSGSEVICADTVLFPEGGGQNTDRGTINDVPVLSVSRRGTEAVHLVSPPVDWSPGTVVRQRLDWGRRWDNMQQHSGQHLVSAILENEHHINTLSWWMAETHPAKVGVSYIELDREMSAEVEAAVTERCNAVITSATPVTVQTFNVGDPQLDSAHTRGLPDDHTGPVRVVTIGDVDINLCCGTHVSNTSQLQVVHLMGSESKKGKHYLYFLVGGRVSSYLQTCVARERSLTKVLNNAPDEHLQLVEKMQKTLKLTTKTNSNLLKEVAQHEAIKIKTSSPKQPYCYIYRRDGDPDFISTFLKELNDNDLLTVIIVGDGKNIPAQLVITGEETLVQKAGTRLCELLDGKGGGKGKRFNAKLNSLKKLSQAENIVKGLIE